MKKKKITGYVKLEIQAGKANPAPPVGTALGPRGLNIMDFCKAFNDQTKNMEPGSPIPVVITVYADRSFSFITKTPPVSYFLKKHAKITKGSSEARKGPSAGNISMTSIKEIAKLKLQDTNAYNIDAAVRTIIGSAESMGLNVVDK